MFFHEQILISIISPYIYISIHIITKLLLLQHILHIYNNMASPRTITGTSSGSDLQSSQENHQQQSTTDIRKRKRMLSNRESARRSRMRKQQHLDDLKSQLTNLRAENNSILTNMNLVAQLHLNIESENSVLRAQISELNHRLQSLNDIIMISCMRSSPKETTAVLTDDDYYGAGNQKVVINGRVDDFLINHWGLVHVNQPIMASPDVFMMY